MSKIEAQIKELQRKQAKIQLFQEVEKFSKTLKDPDRHKGLAKEVIDSIYRFTKRMIYLIEGNKSSSEDSAPTTFADIKEAAPPKPRPKDNPQKQLVDFVKKYSKFGFKKVIAQTLDGNQVTGIVKQVVYPNVTVESDKGGLLEVKPESLRLA